MKRESSLETISQIFLPLSRLYITFVWIPKSRLPNKTFFFYRGLLMAQGVYSNEIAEKTARAALACEAAGPIDGVVLNEAKSPWEEKIRLLRTRDSIEAELHVWKSPEFLAARINRLALYALDSLDPTFVFDMKAMVALKADPKIRRAHNHIWSIYVDSRIERMGLENFFDRSLRRNLFVDSQRSNAWSLSNRLFNRLWRKERFTHLEIIDYARKLGEMVMEDVEDLDPYTFDVEMNRYRGDCSAGDCVEAIPSRELKDVATGLLSFVAGACRGTLVEPCYYGIRFIHEGIVFAEMVTTKKNSLLLTLFDFASESRASYVLGADCQEMEKIQEALKEIYDAISLFSQARRSKEPLGFPM
jgi:hypothetical protein